jgi:hypothetical protein
VTIGLGGKLDQMMHKSFVIKIYLVALILRLIPVIFAHGLGIGLDDMFQYDMLARSIVSGNGYRWYAQADLNQLAPYVDFDLDSVKEYDPVLGIPTSFRAPLYPTFLAVVYFFSGTGFSRFFAARLAQAIFLGAPLVPLTYSVSMKLFPPLLLGEGQGVRSESAARLSAWIVAAYPMLLVYPLGLGTENPFFILLLASFLLLLRSIETPVITNFVLVGIFLGLTTLTRSVILAFAFLALCWLFFVTRRRVWTAILAFLLLVLPWVVRNSLLHGRISGIESSMGYNLYLGYHPQGNGSFIFGPSFDLVSILDDSLRDQVGTEKAIEFIRAQPERILPLAINRLGFFFGLEKRVLMYFYSNNIIGFIPLPLLLTISAILLVPFVIIGISSALSLPFLRWNNKTALLGILFLSYLLPHILILSEDRFHLALIPFLAMLAAQFWVRGFSSLAFQWKGSSAGKYLSALSFLLVILLILNWGVELTRDADKITILLGPSGNQAGFPY